jgi:hypothetical protein
MISEHKFISHVKSAINGLIQLVGKSSIRTYF